MPNQEPVTSHEQPVIDEQHTQEAAVQAHEPPAHEPPAHEPPAYEPVDGQDEWIDEPEELPRRPRRRLFGVGANPIFLGLLGVLLIAGGFIGGVLVEKGETSASSSTAGAAGLASRFAALRRGGAGAGAGSTSTGGSAGAGGGFTRPTAGTLAYLAGDTLYVLNSEGNTVRVTTSASTSVTKTVKSSVKGIHPGETVTVTGATGSNGAISAESISVGSGGGGLAALFGGSAASTGSTGKGGGEPSLFGNGG
jgi:hypothetical protein